MRVLLASLLPLVLLLAQATAPAGEDPADVLREADRAFWRDTRAKGLEGWLGWFAEDAVVFPAAGPLAVGTEDLRAHYAGQAGFPPAGFLWEPQQAGLASSGDLGWTIGRWGNDGTGTAVWSGQYLTVWRRTEAGWKVASDCTYDPRFSSVLPGLEAPPGTIGREVEHTFRSSAGDLAACAGSWWASDTAGNETGGTFLALWRRNADGAQELVAETGVVHPRR